MISFGKWKIEPNQARCEKVIAPFVKSQTNLFGNEFSFTYLGLNTARAVELIKSSK